MMKLNKGDKVTIKTSNSKVDHLAEVLDPNPRKDGKILVATTVLLGLEVTTKNGNWKGMYGELEVWIFPKEITGKVRTH